MELLLYSGEYTVILHVSSHCIFSKTLSGVTIVIIPGIQVREWKYREVLLFALCSVGSHVAGV